MPAAKSSAKILPIADGLTVPLYHWAPAVNGYLNFGDEIGPMVVAELLRRHPSKVKVIAPQPGRAKLLAVGSVVHQARNGDAIWGSGVNGKSWPRNLETHKRIKVASVRGPLTKDAFDRYGIACPAIYGDPGLLFPSLFRTQLDEEIALIPEEERGKTFFVPNLNDERWLDRDILGRTSGVHWLSPNQPPLKIAAQIATAERVLSSSLHGIVLADALAIPVHPVLSMFEPAFKYADYLLGTGRTPVPFAASLLEGLNSPNLPFATFDAQALEASFPLALLTGR